MTKREREKNKVYETLIQIRLCTRRCVNGHTPVPFRQRNVVVNPLVRGNRWYLSLGRPLLSATCILIWCFFSVKRVPSQYNRNWVRKKRNLSVCINLDDDLFSLVPSTTRLVLGSVTYQVLLKVTQCYNKATLSKNWSAEGRWVVVTQCTKFMSTQNVHISSGLMLDVLSN